MDEKLLNIIVRNERTINTLIDVTCSWIGKPKIVKI